MNPAIPPQPVPTSFMVGQVPLPDGSIGIMLSINTPTGVHVSFLDQASARKLGVDLQKYGSAGSLLIPQEGLKTA